MMLCLMSSQYGDRWRKAIDTLRLARCCKFIFNTQTMLYWTVEREKTLPCNNTWASVEYVHDYLVCSHNSKWLQFRSNNSKRTVRIHRIRFHFFFVLYVFFHMRMVAGAIECCWVVNTHKHYALVVQNPLQSDSHKHNAETQATTHITHVEIISTLGHRSYRFCHCFWFCLVSSSESRYLLISACLIQAFCLYWWCYAVISVYKKMIHCSTDYWMLSNWTLLALHNFIFFSLFSIRFGVSINKFTWIFRFVLYLRDILLYSIFMETNCVSLQCQRTQFIKRKGKQICRFR